MNKNFFLLFWLFLLSFTFFILAQKLVVGLDCYHNNENTPHYTWQQTSVGGYSQFAQIILALGADTISIKTKLDFAALAPLDVLIVVDPDTPNESSNPQYFSQEEADAVDKWVISGGSLMLLGNNKGNAEFVNFNILASKFGITFNEDTQSGGPDFGPLPNHFIFNGCDTLHIVGICTQTILSPAEAIFTYNGNILISIAQKGKGKVFAMGDPWIYNEYINSKDNKICVTNVMKWLLDKQTISVHKLEILKSFVPMSSNKFLLNGRIVNFNNKLSSSVYLKKVNNGNVILIDKHIK